MRNETNSIYRAFDGKLVGRPELKVAVCETVLKLPPELIEQVTRSCWFLSSSDSAWAFTIKGSEVANDFIIILSDELIGQPQTQIQYTIMHEIGHVVLGHRNSIGELQTQTEIDRQEKEADEFAQKYH